MAESVHPLSKRQVEEVHRGRVVSVYQPGQMVFYFGHVPMGIWILVSGEIALRDKQTIVSYIVGPTILGLEECMSTGPYQYTVQALTRCEFIFIGKEEVPSALQQPPLAQFIA